MFERERGSGVSELNRRFRGRSESPDPSALLADTAVLLPRAHVSSQRAMSAFNASSFRRALARQCCGGEDVAWHDPAGETVGTAGPHAPCAAYPGPCDITDSRVTGLNKVGAHTPLHALDTEQDARDQPLEDGNFDTKFRRLLTPPNTRWKFLLSRTPEEAPSIEDGRGFARSDTWADIEVPISIECGGFGQPFYTNFVYPFKCDPPKIASAINYVGCYQQAIDVPIDWRGRRIFLYFEGAGSALHCWLDGKFVGYSQDSFLPAEFELTEHVHNKLARLEANQDAAGPTALSCTLSVKCYRFCDGSYMEAQDMWWLSGIHRDVVLYSLPACGAIWDYVVTTDPVFAGGCAGGGGGGGGGGEEVMAMHSVRLSVEVEVRQLETGMRLALAQRAKVPLPTDASALRAFANQTQPQTPLEEGCSEQGAARAGGLAPLSALSVEVSLYGPHRLLPGQSSTAPAGEPLARNTVALSTAGCVRGDVARTGTGSLEGAGAGGRGSVAAFGDHDLGAACCGQGGAHPCPHGFEEEVLLGKRVMDMDARTVPLMAWSPDSPWLYTLVISLWNGTECIQAEVSRVGLRSVQIRDGCLLANGSPVEVRGVNRHEHDHLRGKHVSRASMIRDITAMKQLNINAVRTAHYPNCNLWYALCDAYGLWLCDEANIETHGIVTDKDEDYLADHSGWTHAYLERLTRMVRRDRNHASVLMWSLGNESSYGRNHDEMYRWLKATDPTRPVQYESCGGAGATDIICPMYLPPAQVEALTRLGNQNKASLQLGRRWPQGSHKVLRPVILCEYAHAMNNSVGNLDEYWEVFRRHRCLQGGFIWDWMDQGLVKKNSDGESFWAYGGDFGEHVHDGMWNINGLTWPDGSWHPSCFQVKKTLCPIRIDIQVRRLPRDPVRHVASISFSKGFDRQLLACLGWKWSLEIDGDVVSAIVPQAFPLVAGSGLGAPDGVFLLEEVELGEIAPPRPGMRHTTDGEHGAPGREAILTVCVVVMTTQTWAPVAHEITFEQALIPAHATNSSAAGCSGRGDEGPGWRVPSQVTLDWARDKSRAEGCSNEEAAGNGAGLRAHVREGSVIVEGPDALCLVWDCKDAALVRYSKAGVEFVAEGQSLQRCNAASAGSTGGASKSVRQIFWRAHTDNDNGGPDTLARFGATRQMYPAECGFDKATPRVRGAMAFGLWWMDLFGDSSYGRMWEKKGLERLRAVDAQVEVMGQRDDGGEQGIGVLAVRCRCAFVADGTSTNIPCESLYTIHLDGSVVVENTCMIAADMPPMPRIGMQLTLNQQFQELTYFGRGPVENYPDRCSGSKLGRYHCQVDDTFVPYIVPCDNGLRSHVRWAALTDPTGRGLVISAASPDDTLCLSAHRCTSHDLHHALHTPDVKFREEITVTVDHRHMPCGGNDSWTRAHLPQYLIKPGKYTYSVQLVPIASAGSIGRPLPPRTRGAPSSYTPPAQAQVFMARLKHSSRAFMAAVPVVLAERIVHLASLKAIIWITVLIAALVLVILIVALVPRA